MTKIASVVIAAVAVLLSASPVHAWWCTGHMITAEIARRSLRHGVEDKIAPYIHFMNKFGPFTQSPDMVQAACWADDIRHQGVTPMRGWHFVNQPFDPSKFPLPPSSELMKDNVVTEIDSLRRTPSDRTGRRKQWIMAYVLMNLIHFYGDIHQPLHTAELYSAQFPKGDEGGNLFKVLVNGTVWGLHEVWDSVCLEYTHGPFVRPLSGANATFIQSQAARVMAEAVVPRKAKEMVDPATIAKEGLGYVKTDVYANLTANHSLPAAYLPQCRKIATLRLAEGGFRLATVLSDIFDHRREDEDRLEYALSQLEHHRATFTRSGLKVRHP